MRLDRMLLRRVTDLGMLIRYGFDLGKMTSKKAQKMNVDEIVAKWTEAIVVMATAHDALADCRATVALYRALRAASA